MENVKEHEENQKRWDALVDELLDSVAVMDGEALELLIQVAKRFENL